MAMEHFLLVAEYCTLLAPSTYHQSFLLLHVVHILNPVSLAEPAAPQNHPQSQLRNCHLWNASFQVQELVALHTKGKVTHYTRIGVSLARIRLAILCVALMHDPVTMNKSRSCTLHLKTFSCS
ncbi:hypothetical protein CEK26_012007 [Fusarium fujikuroi]|uniref:Uncharacterized protein n=1 Tax=Fusarium fujikuroi TaxID=5127 RepID=A0A5Q3DMM4_FUSFU|nr:hypothetical protein CEK27_012024 [Fusarium fujikuroi]QGI98938.1 hypothetical protein CEK26_012007 [Fusarium fujikuroi]VTT74926.1 unnamed protein product [Fusarium fujikuroi]VTT77961.1 unnamed protein product [Fusarium fujikuroi]